MLKKWRQRWTKRVASEEIYIEVDIPIRYVLDFSFYSISPDLFYSDLVCMYLYMGKKRY